MRKRGQLDQPFIYIFAIIVIAFIIWFGFTYLSKTNALGEKALYVQFKSDLQDAITNTYNKNEGTLLTFSPSSANKPLALPTAIKQICFQDLGTKTKLTPDNQEYQAFIINNLSPAEKNLCIPAYGRLSFKLENKVIEKQTRVIIAKV